MVIFSHRGIGFGKKENSLEAMTSAVNSGFSVEIDLRMRNNNIALSHDSADSVNPQELDDLLKIIKDNPDKLFALHLKEDSEILFSKIGVSLKPFNNCLVFVTDFAQGSFVREMSVILGPERLALYVTDKNIKQDLISRVNYLWLDETKGDIYQRLDYFFTFGKKIILCSPELFKKDYHKNLDNFKNTLSSNKGDIFGICTDFADTILNQYNTICSICGSKDYQTLFKTKDFRFGVDNTAFNIVKCARCGFLFLNPRPKESQTARFYPPAFNQRDTSLCYKFIQPCFRIAQRATIKLFKQYKKNGRALDIGCGNGEFVSAMLHQGYDAFGFEQNSEAGKFIHKEIAGRILYNDLKEGSFADKSFDIITMFQSLEHIYNPQNLFQQINRLIKDDGILYVCVPNMDFFEFALFGPYAYNLEVPRHAYFFNRKTLKEFLAKFGFKVELFLRDSLFEFVSTPASIFYSLCYFAQDRKIPLNNIIKGIFYLPLVFLKLILRFGFMFQDQNLKVLCRKR